MKKLIGALLFIGALGYGQNTQNPSTITLGASAPTGVTQISTSVHGNIGSKQYYYWVVANFAIGQAGATNSFVRNAPDTLTGSNYVTITWNPVVGAINYDVLRTTTPYIPSPCTCRIVLHTANTTYNNNNTSISAYTYTPISNAMATLRLDNQSYSQPVIYSDTPWNSLTFAGLPVASATKGLTFLVTDAASSSTCTAGGGTNTPALCWSNGSSWIAIGGGGGGTGCTTTGSSGQLLIDNGAGGCSSSADWSISSHVLIGGSGTSFSTAGSVSTGIGGTVGGILSLGQGTAPSFLANGFNLFAPTSIATGYGWLVPTGAATGIIRGDNSGGTVTLSQSEISGDGTTNGSNVLTVTKINNTTPGGTCTNQVVTSISSSAVPTCNSIVNAEITNGTIDLTTKVTGILPSANGGTNNAFFKVSGPTTTAKTYTFPDSNATIPQVVASGASALNTVLITSASHNVTTISATGVLTTDTIIANVNGAIIGVTGYVPSTSGTLMVYAYPTADNINFDVVNNTSGSITPGAVTVNWKVIR